MSSQPVRPLRRERRAAALAKRRSAPRRAAYAPRRIGIGLVSIVALAAGGLLVAILLILNGRPTAPTIEVTRASAPAGIATAGFVLGNAGAPVTIDLYEDFQCPACERWGANVFPSIVRNELTAGTVKIAFHDLSFIGPESAAAARAAWAANEQGRFWDMWATIYANQGSRENGGAYSDSRLIAMADTLDLDPTRFAADLDSAAAAAWVADSAAAATAAGVSSTPSLVIAGTLLDDSGYAAVSAAIAAATP